MKKLALYRLLALASAVFLYAALACKSTPPPIEQDLTPAGFFQKAQEASDAGKYSLALRYYGAFQGKYPDERDRNLWARYEIALLYHKMGKDETALKLFDELIALYSGEDAAGLPQGPRLLAEKIKARITGAEAQK